MKGMDDWYSKNRLDIDALGGSDLLISYYGDSLPKALRTIYPDYKWYPWRFKDLQSKGIWSQPENRQSFFFQSNLKPKKLIYLFPSGKIFFSGFLSI
jgi:hypothetical protein